MKLLPHSIYFKAFLILLLSQCLYSCKTANETRASNNEAIVVSHPEIISQIQTIPEVRSIQAVNRNSIYDSNYEIWFDMPIDHEDQSKGGQCTMIHRSLYPNDVDASVPYVAPLNFSREDPRIYSFLNSVGTEEQRQQIHDFQALCFERKNELLVEMLKLQEEFDYEWDLPLKTIIDYYILEYSFAFWQWGGVRFKDIPTSSASSEIIIQHLLDVSGVYFFESSGVEKLRPFFWAGLTEIGVYGYETEPFKEYLGTTRPYLFDFTAPKGTYPVYDSDRVEKVQKYLDTDASNMLFIYGDLDTWAATRVSLNEDALKRDNYVMVFDKGHHGTRISSFKKKDQKFMIELLEKWTAQDVQ